MKKSDLLLGILAGAAAGAFVGILFAPDKGSATRRKLKHKGKEVLEDLADKAYILAAYANELNNEVDRLSDQIAADIEEVTIEATDRVGKYLRKEEG
jgi:gas vesicle protein